MNEEEVEVEGKTDEEIVSILSARIERAMNDESGDISDLRQRALSAYRGDRTGDERDGRSKIVTREVFETVEWALPSLVRPFVAGKRPVEFPPSNPEDAAAADQESDIVNHAMLHHGDGAATLYQWFKDAALYPTAYVKVYHREQVRRTFETFYELTTPQLMQLDEHEEYTLLEAEQASPTDEEIQVAMAEAAMMGVELPPMEPGTWTVRVQRDWIDQENTWEVTPPDEVLVDNELESWDLDKAEWVIHRQRKSFSQLVREGFDPEALESVGDGDDGEVEHHSERTNRLFYVDDTPFNSEEHDESLRMYTVHECYGWIDADGDGVAEFRQIILVGKNVFYNEEVDYQPFVAVSMILEAHKHAGTSFYDISHDLQRYSTQLKRGLLDNANDINDPRKYVGEEALSQDADTLGALLDPNRRFIPTGDPSHIIDETHQPIIGEVLSAIQNLDSDRQMRTGVAPQLSLDPNLLKQATEGAYMAAEAAASQRLELIVRNLAATGVSRVAVKFHQLFRMYPMKDEVMQIRGQYVPIDPTKWPERPATRICVGLGYNNSQTQLALLTQMLQLQERLMQARMADPSKIYHTVDKLVEATNLGLTEQFIIPPDQVPPPPPPDPATVASIENLQADTAYKQAQVRETEADTMATIAELQQSVEELRAQLRQMGADMLNTGADTTLKLSQARALQAGRNE